MAALHKRRIPETGWIEISEASGTEQEANVRKMPLFGWRNTAIRRPRDVEPHVPAMKHTDPVHYRPSVYNPNAGHRPVPALPPPLAEIVATPQVSSVTKSRILMAIHEGIAIIEAGHRRQARRQWAISLLFLLVASGACGMFILKSAQLAPDWNISLCITAMALIILYIIGVVVGHSRAYWKAVQQNEQSR